MIRLQQLSHSHGRYLQVFTKYVCRNPVWNIVPWQVVAFHEVGRCYIWALSVAISPGVASSSHQTKLWVMMTLLVAQLISREDDLNMSARVDAPVEIFPTTSSSAPAQPLPHIPPSQRRMCGGKNIKPNWCWKKDCQQVQPGLFLSTPSKARILNAVILAETCLSSGTSNFSFGQTPETGRICLGDDLPRNQPSAAKPEAKQWKWSWVTAPRLGRGNLD